MTHAVGLRSWSDGKRDIDSSPPPLHYLHKSWRRRAVGPPPPCVLRATQRPPAAYVRGWTATCHAVRVRNSVSVGRASVGKLCLFALVCLPALCPSVRCPLLPSLPFPRPSAFRLASSLLFSVQHVAAVQWSMRRWRISVSIGCGIAKSHFENSSADQSDGLTTVKRPSSLAINTPSTVGLIFALVDRRRTAQNEPRARVGRETL